MDYLTTHINLVYTVCGLAMLVSGGELLVRGGVALAEKMKIPKLIIGLTIIGFGTSMPELLVSLQAAQAGAPDLAAGNVIGSNTANILLILGLGLLIRPIAVTAKGLRRDAIMMLLASAALVWLGYKGIIDRQTGLIMLGILIAYILLAYVTRAKTPDTPKNAGSGSPLMALIMSAFGLGLLIFGADLLITGAKAVATEMGVSEAVIGLSLVAVGTSLPELTVSLIAAIRGQNEVSLGNVLGSNIFNILGILGITAAIKPLSLNPDFVYADLPVMMTTALLLALLILRGKTIGRLWGLLCLVGFAGYMAWLFHTHGA